MRYSATFIALAAATLSVAQTSDIPKYDSSLNMTLPNPGLVDLSERSDWCEAQYNTCLSLCGGDFKDNDCEETDLSYKCNCDNGTAPGLQFYTQTMPTFICKELFAECINAHPDKRDQDLCISNIDDKCATQAPPKEKSDDDDDDDSDDSESSSTTASRQSSTSSSSNSDATDDTVSTTESDGYAAPTMAPAGNVAAVAAIGVLAYLV